MVTQILGLEIVMFCKLSLSSAARGNEKDVQNTEITVEKNASCKEE